MKGVDRKILINIIIIAFFLGGFIISRDFDKFSDLITFLSIMVGFKITSLSILFNSKLKKVLYDRKIPIYGSELHRIKYFYQSSITFDIVSILIIFLIPRFIYVIDLKGYIVSISKSLIVLPILAGSFFCFYKLFKDLLQIFVYPTNE